MQIDHTSITSSILSPNSNRTNVYTLIQDSTISRMGHHNCLSIVALRSWNNACWQSKANLFSVYWPSPLTFTLDPSPWPLPLILTLTLDPHPWPSTLTLDLRPTFYHADDSTRHKRSNLIALNQGNQNPQNDMIASFSFALTAHVTQWSNYFSTGRDFDSTIKFNASTGEDHCGWFICGTEVAFDIKHAGWFHIFPFFLSETSKLQSAVYSEWKHFCLTLHCCWIHWEKLKTDLMKIDILAPPCIRESAKLLT